MKNMKKLAAYIANIFSYITHNCMTKQVYNFAGTFLFNKYHNVNSFFLANSTSYMTADVRTRNFGFNTQCLKTHLGGWISGNVRGAFRK